MACNRLRLGFMFSLSSIVLSRDDAELVRTKVGRVIRQQASLRDLLVADARATTPPMSPVTENCYQAVTGDILSCQTSRFLDVLSLSREETMPQ